MSGEFRSDDWDSYRMVYKDPHREIEPAEREIAIVDAALGSLRDEGILPGIDYDRDLFAAHRRAVAERFEIPWTAITPRMQRLLYAINAIVRPRSVIGAGIFCGNTLISNIGAGVGPGACYEASRLVGVEIDPERAALAERNVRTLSRGESVEILAEDAVGVVRDWEGTIDLLYLDADGTRETGKGIYLTILEAAWPKLADGAIVIAHNSINCAERLELYLTFVRERMISMNVFIDGEGIEVSRRRAARCLPR